MITQLEAQHMFFPKIRQDGQKFRKFRQVVATVAAGGEKVVSLTSDGVETENVAKKGDYIVTNQTEAEEQYVVTEHKFKEKYMLIEKWDDGRARYQPKGEVVGVKLTPELIEEFGLEDEFEIESPWDEPQKVKMNDFIVAPLDYSEVYRIASKEFGETYRAIV